KIYSRMLSCLTQMTSLISENEHWAAAAKILRKADGWIKKVHLPWIVLSYYELRGRVESKLHSKSAESYLKRAVQIVEKMRVEIPAEDLRISYLEDKLAPYDAIIAMNLEQGKRRSIWEAFQFSERARSRVLLDLLDGALSFERGSDESIQLVAELNA